jgi:hypothetical protein
MRIISEDWTLSERLGETLSFHVVNNRSRINEDALDPDKLSRKSHTLSGQSPFI